jgi:general secretion pathway protein K
MIRQRGFALIVVLWTMTLLSFVVAQFTASGRTEAQIATNSRGIAAAQAAADGAVQQAILRLLQGSWQPDGSAQQILVGGVPVTVWIENQSHKLNPNLVSAGAMQQVLMRIGVDRAKAASLAAAIVEWRASNRREGAASAKLAAYQAAGLPYAPPGRPFDSEDELGLVLGMTPSIMERLLPLVSVYQESGEVEPVAADQRAAPREAWQFGAAGRVMVAIIVAEAQERSGARFKRQIVARLRADASLDQPPYQILTWERRTD